MRITTWRNSLLGLLISIPFLAIGQNGKILGKIIDKYSELPLVGTSVKIGDSGTVSNESGVFVLDIAAGNYEVEISYIGYIMQVIPVNIGSGQSVELEVELVESNLLLETAVITGNKFENRVAESTVSIDVIKVGFIENNNSQTIDAVLDKIPGVQILDDQANIRGGSGWSYGAGSRVMLLVDDMPALQGDAGIPQWDDIPVENISQVEVVKGSSSALYGSAALNGIINVRTAYATSEPETKISIAHTRFGSPADAKKKWWTHTPRYSSISLLHKQKIGKLDLVAGGYYFNQDSAYSFNQDSYRRKTRLNLNLRYRLTDRLSFGINTLINDGYNSSFFLWQNGSSGAYKPFQGTVSKGTNFRFFIDPSITYFDKHNNKHKFQSRWYHVKNDLNLDQSNKSDNFFAEYQFQKEIESADLRLTSGLLTSNMRSDSDLFSDTIITSNNYAAYVQLDKTLFTNLNISLGTRYEYNRHNTPTNFMGINIPNGVIDEGKLISRVGLNYEMADYTFLRASWGQGYRYPTITERFIRTSFSGFVIFPNAFLNSETGWSSEVGLKQGFRLFDFEGFFDFSTFISEYQDMMEFTFYQEDGLSGFQSQNIGNTQIKGFEIGINGRSKLFSIPITIFGGYTYIDPVYKEFTEQAKNASSVDYNILKYRTKHSMTIDLQGEWKKLSLGLAMIGSSHMEAIDKQLSIFATIGQYRAINNGGYKRFDARVAYTMEKWKVSFLVGNLLNEEYTERPALLEPPRNFSFRVDMAL